LNKGGICLDMISPLFEKEGKGRFSDEATWNN
jgi:hypothetical protein